jgi:hypothetical protein
MTNPPNMSVTDSAGFQPMPKSMGVVEIIEREPLPEWALELAYCAVDLHANQKHAILIASFLNGRWRVAISQEKSSGFVK